MSELVSHLNELIFKILKIFSPEMPKPSSEIGESNLEEDQKQKLSLQLKNSPSVFRALSAHCMFKTIKSKRVIKYAGQVLRSIYECYIAEVRTDFRATPLVRIYFCVLVLQIKNSTRKH